MVGTLQSIPYHWRDFNLITSLEVLEHIENPLFFLTKLFQLLTDGGYLVLSIPNFFYQMWVLDEPYPPPEHLTIWSTKALKFVLNKVGFKNIRFLYTQDFTPAGYIIASILSKKLLPSNMREISLKQAGILAHFSLVADSKKNNSFLFKVFKTIAKMNLNLLARTIFRVKKLSRWTIVIAQKD
jgi:hypothetical protein